MSDRAVVRWTPEAKARVCALYEEGMLSGTEIAAVIRGEHSLQISKNSVIGIAFPARPERAQRRSRAVPNRRPGRSRCPPRQRNLNRRAPAPAEGCSVAHRVIESEAGPGRHPAAASRGHGCPGAQAETRSQGCGGRRPRLAPDPDLGVQRRPVPLHRRRSQGDRDVLRARHSARFALGPHHFKLCTVPARRPVHVWLPEHRRAA